MKSAKEKLLVVEDEEISRKNLEHILKKEGYDIIAVDSGVKALDLLNSQSFDLVITDLKMEHVDGMQVLRKTRELQPYTEVIMITGYATVDSSVQAMREGAYYYIAKPYKIDEVRKIAQEALLKRRLQVENLALRETLSQHQQIPFHHISHLLYTPLHRAIPTIAGAAVRACAARDPIMRWATRSR